MSLFGPNSGSFTNNIDAGFYLQISGGFPFINFDPLDYMGYDRTTNRLFFISGGADNWHARASDFLFFTIPRIPSYTVATLPAAASFTRGMIYVADGTLNKRLAISDGTNWRWPDGAIVS